MKKYTSFLFVFLLGVFTLTSFKADVPKKTAEGIQWITIEEAYSRIQKEPRKVLIDVYTDWCGWCKVMDRETFTDKAVAAYIHKNYYAVKLDAEQKAAITLGNKKFVSQGRTHELALALTNNQPSYPTTVFLDDQFQMIQPLPGYMKAKEFHEVITFIGGNHYKKEAFENYKSKTYPTLFPKK
jgi:thioredoxin-related protein